MLAPWDLKRRIDALGIGIVSGKTVFLSNSTLHYFIPTPVQALHILALDGGTVKT